MARGNARPYSRPPAHDGPLWIDGINVRSIGVRGSIASIAGRTDDKDGLRLIIQQCCRDMTGLRGPNNGMILYRTCLALYQQLVGSWNKSDQDILTWLLYHAAHPEMLEGPGGWAHERHLSPRAIEEIARITILP